MSERYARQELIRGWDPLVIETARILVIGAGTTGNEVIKNLVLLGIGHITIIDYDKIEEVNLSRSILYRDEDIGLPKAETAARRACQINSSLDIKGMTCDVIYDIGSQFFTNFDCVILTVDNLEARMHVNRYCWQNAIPLIDTGMAGQHGDVFMSLPPNGGCIECSWRISDYQRLSEKYSCLKLGRDSDERKIPMVITTGAVIGGIAVQECIRYLHARKNNSNRKNSPVMDNMAYYYIAEETQTLLAFTKSPNPNCLGHSNHSPQSPVLQITANLDDHIDDLIKLLQIKLQTDELELYTDKEIAYTFKCSHCGCSVALPPIYLGIFRRSLCPNCFELSILPKLSTAQLLPGYTLKELHVPSSHRLKVLYSRNDETQECWLETN